MYHTPTHRSQTGPLSAGYETVSDMATYNGYTYFFLDTPKYGPYVCSISIPSSRQANTT